MGGKTAGEDLIHRGLAKTAAWVNHNDYLLNSAKSQNLIFGPNLLYTHILLKMISCVIPLPQAHVTKDLGVLVNCLLSLSTKFGKAVTKAKGCLLTSGSLS